MYCTQPQSTFPLEEKSIDDESSSFLKTVEAIPREFCDELLPEQ